MEMVFFILLIVTIVLFFVYRTTIKGKIGEEKVALVLDALPSSSYKTINNLLIYQNGYSSQIDHVVVSEYGIFVIETKNYKGGYTAVTIASIGLKIYLETNTNFVIQ